jgi:hypothetical protein
MEEDLRELAFQLATIHHTDECYAELRSKVRIAAKEALAPPEGQPHNGWLQSGSLLFRLTDERRPQNRDEINVSMADGSRDVESLTRRAGQLLDQIRSTTQSAPQRPSVSHVTVMAQMLGLRLAKEHALYLTMETATELVTAMLTTLPAPAMTNTNRDESGLYAVHFLDSSDDEKYYFIAQFQQGEWSAINSGDPIDEQGIISAWLLTRLTAQDAMAMPGHWQPRKPV